MAKRSQFKMSLSERQRRSFSENFKRVKVKEIESGVTRVDDLCRQYEVSNTSVYRWMKLYGTKSHATEKMVVETLSDTQQLLALKKQVAAWSAPSGKSRSCWTLKTR
jgi:transposase-like protein